MAIQQVLLGYGGSAAVAYTTLNPSDKAAGITLSGGNLVASETPGSNSGLARSVKALSGKQYFEAVLTLVAPGTASAGVGIANNSASLTVSLAYANANGWAYWATGTGARHNSVTAVSNSSVQGDVLGFAVDVPNSKMWIRKNGTWIQGDPVAATSPIWTNLSGTIYAAACPWANGNIITMRFDPASFRDAAPTGYSPVTA